MLVWSGVLSFIQQSSLIVSSFELGLFMRTCNLHEQHSTFTCLAVCLVNHVSLVLLRPSSAWRCKNRPPLSRTFLVLCLPLLLTV